MSVVPLMPEVDFAYNPLPDLEDRVAKLQEIAGRIAPVYYKGEPAWMVLRYADVARYLGDDAYIPAAPEFQRNWDTQGTQPLMMEGAAHRASRGALEVPFKPGAVRRLAESILIPVADRLIDDFGDRREIDLVHSYTRRYTFYVMSTILGIPVEEEDQLITLIYDLLQGRPTETDPAVVRQNTLASVAKVNDYLRPIVEAHRREPKEDMISYLLSATENGVPLDEKTLYDYIRFVFPAGAETTHLSIGRLMSNVLADSSLRDELVAEPAKRAAAVEESLRITPAVSTAARLLVKDTMICDMNIPAGTTVLFSILGGNRDADVFANPSTFSISAKRKPVLSFGMGIHYCLGLHLAKAAMLASLNRLLDRLPGLRLSRTPPPAGGIIFRGIPELYVTFDRILPAKA